LNGTRRHQGRWLALTSLWTAWLLYMTLTPDNTPNTNVPVPFLGHAQALHCVLTACPQSADSLRALCVDLLGNVAVFMPLGVGLAALLHRSARLTMHRPRAVRPGSRRATLVLCILGGALLSSSIEAVQYTMPTRAADLTDLALNSLGTALGAALWQSTRRVDRIFFVGYHNKAEGADTKENERWCK
jgi:glycopeptide antibiotics resistance protein